MSTLITGVSGFIGFNLCRKLLAKGESLVGLHSPKDFRESPEQEKIANQRIDKLQSSANANHIAILPNDLQGAESIQQVMVEHRPTTVIHLPNIENSPTESQQAIAATINVLEACRLNEVRHCIMNSSHAVYFPHQHSNMSVRELTEHPRNLKAATARACELLTHSYSQQYQLPCTIVRLFNVYGPQADSINFVTQLWDKIQRGQRIDINDYLGHEFDFTYIEDVCNTFVRLLEHPAKPNPDWILDEEYLDSSDAPWRIYNSGTGTGTNILALIATLEEILGKKAILDTYDNARTAVQFKQIADNTELLRDTGFQPRTSLYSGLKSML